MRFGIQSKPLNNNNCPFPRSLASHDSEAIDFRHQQSQPVAAPENILCGQFKAGRMTAPLLATSKFSTRSRGGMIPQNTEIESRQQENENRNRSLTRRFVSIDHSYAKRFAAIARENRDCEPNKLWTRSASFRRSATCTRCTSARAVPPTRLSSFTTPNRIAVCHSVSLTETSRERNRGISNPFALRFDIKIVEQKKEKKNSE